MSFRRPVKLAALVAVLVMTAFSVAAKDLEDKKWIKVSSPNFEIYSRIGKTSTVDMLRHLEALRAVLLAFNMAGADADFPTVMIALSNQKEYLQIVGEADFAGLFTAGLRQNHIVLRNVSGMAEANIVLHEYVHFLTNNTSSFTYPAWYMEGYAEFLGVAHISGKNIELFGYSEGRIRTLQSHDWLPPEKILTSHDVRKLNDREQGLFYAQSWALVHFLSMGRRGVSDPNVRDGLESYARLRLEKEGEVAAFERAFQLDVANLNERLATYLNKEFVGKRAPLEVFLPHFDPQLEEPGAGEVALALGSTAMAFESMEEAESFFRKALSDSRTEAAALAGLGRISMRRESYDEAQSYFDQAASKAPNDATVLLDRATFYSQLSEVTEDTSATREYDRIAEKGYAAIAELGTTSAEYDLSLGLHLIASQQEYVSALRSIESAYRKLPSNGEVQVALLNAYLSVSRYEDAIFVARILQARSFEQPGMFESLQELIEDLQARIDPLSDN